MTVIDDEMPVATAQEIVDELKRWRYLYENAIPVTYEVKCLTNTINSLDGLDLVQTVSDWVDWLDKIAMSYESQGLFNAALKIENWE
jgi:hypothetical protein